MFAFRMDTVNKYMFTGTASPNTTAAGTYVTCYSFTKIYLRRGTQEPGIRSPRAPRWESGRFAELAEHEALTTAGRTPKLNLHQLHLVALGIKAL